MIDDVPFQDIDESHLQQLLTLQTPEVKTLDYKRELNIKTDKHKKEFLADISSFANASGGYLIFGIDAPDGVPISIDGLDVSNPDSEILRLENIIRDGLAPRIPGLETRAIPLESGRHILIFRIPQSWIAPHMVKFGDSSRFFARNSAGKYQLDITEIRNAFIMSETASERIRNFRVDRVNRVLTGETPIALEEGAKQVLHLVPLSALRAESQVDFGALTRNSFMGLSKVPKSQELTHGPRYNFDGLLLINAPRTVSIARWYIQLFRNGSVEFVRVIGNQNDHELTPVFDIHLVDMLPSLVKYQQVMGVQAPIITLLSMVDVRGYAIASKRQSFYTDRVIPIDRDVLSVPEIVIEDMDCDPISTLKPLFDPVWNAAGWPKSPNY